MYVDLRRTNLEHPRSKRVNRQSNRGRVIMAQPGVNTIRRRWAYDLAINFNALTNMTAALIRRRMRKGWSLTEAVTTAG